MAERIMHKNPGIIVAYDRNRIIGRDNDMPWRGKLSADMAHFKATTLGNIVLMGRNTYESIGRPLPGRETRVLTTDPLFRPEGITVTHSPEEALLIDEDDERELYVAGGEKVYKLFLPIARFIVASEIEASFQGDTHFPEIDSTWVKTTVDDIKSDDESQLPFSVVRYVKRSKFIDSSKARNSAQREQFSTIEKDGVCPFCEGKLEKYHQKEIIEDAEFWSITTNMYPYEGAEKHLLAIAKRHIEHVGELEPEEWSELGRLVSAHTKNMGSGGLAMRFGDFMQNAASVNHLHIHLFETKLPLRSGEKLGFKISR